MMPEIFSSDEDFGQWFNFTDKDDRKNVELVESLHKIMRPFLLRRAKADLETKLPDKIELIVNVRFNKV